MNADPPSRSPAPPPIVSAYYARYPEESRLTEGGFRLEYERTRDMLRRLLPPPPARVVDVGGAAGVYSFWLAGLGYEVHLVDAADRLVAEARRRNEEAATRIASMTVADARRIPRDDASAEAVLIMGPLYHLTERAERIDALGEARRLLAPGGLVAAAAISRYASTIDGLARRLVRDPRFVSIRDRDLRDGQHRNETDQDAYFTTSFFHRPEDLAQELTEAGFVDVRVLGVEGLGGLLGDFEERWADETARAEIIEAARLLEEEPSVRGVSPHLMGVGRAP